MKVGLIIPQGGKHEYDGWEPAAAWQRTLDLTQHAEHIGFESVWALDHFHTAPESTDEITFESFTMLAAMASATSRVRLGHMVVCAGFRNPGLTAKMVSTLDVISNGRFELGIGAGWKEDEWTAYGYGFPAVADRVALLGENLEVISRMLAAGRADFEGRFATVRGAINVPKGIQPRIPVIVGGNGRKVAGLAVRFADELNFFDVPPDDVARRIVEARAACEAVGRDPDSMTFSVYALEDALREPGQARVDYLASFTSIGVRRMMCFVGRWDPTVRAQELFAQDCRAAGVELGDA